MHFNLIKPSFCLFLKKVQIFFWQLILERLPTCGNLNRRECCRKESDWIVLCVWGSLKRRITCFYRWSFAIRPYIIWLLSCLEQEWFFKKCSSTPYYFSSSSWRKKHLKGLILIWHVFDMPQRKRFGRLFTFIFSWMN